MKSALLLLPLIAFAVSCSNIRSKQLVGAEPVDLTSEGNEKELSGEWVDNEGEVIGSIKVTNAAKGEILFTPKKKKGEKQDESSKIFIRSSDDYVFLNYEPDDKGERMWYLLGGGPNELLIWTPNNDAFRKLITEGKIKGVNDPTTEKDAQGNDVQKKNAGAVIDDPKGEWVEKLVAGEFGVPFNWKNPMVLRKKAVVK